MKRTFQIVCVAAIVAALGAIAMAEPIYIESFGNLGDGNGQFDRPFGIAVDSAGSVYVADDRNNRIQKFTQSGGSLSHEWSFGSDGSGDGEISGPKDVAVDSAGNVYVADSNNHRIQKFTQSGGSLSHEWSFGSMGAGDGQFNTPYGVAVDMANNVYVTDYLNDRIQKLSQSGGLVSHEWSFGSLGNGDGQFYSPADITVDSAGNLYVADERNHRIQKLSQSGGSVSHEWSFGNHGILDGEFEYPSGVAMDSAGNVYVAEDGNDRIQKLSQSGGSVSHEWSFGSKGTGNGEFKTPEGVAVDSTGNVYVADTANNRIQRFFDPDALPAGQTATFASLTVWSDSSLGNSLTLDSGKTLQIIGTTTIASGGTLTLSSAILNTARLLIDRGGVLNVEGTVSGPIEGGLDRQINGIGDAALGDSNRYDGFIHNGTLAVGSHTMTLHSKGHIGLGILTQLSGGTLRAPNGIALGVGRNLSGFGAVDATVSATFGSTIEATGNLALGDANAYDGFFSDGSLLTGAHTVTINDRNEAVLGSLTQLGDGASGGTLTAGNASPSDTYAHFLLEQGKNMVGRGSVNGNYKNHGHVIGDGTATAERLIFNDPWIVSGKGTFTNTLILGTFAPGDSPTITQGANQGFGGTVEIELGGMTPGSGDDNHDQINDTATILLSSSTMLDILPWNNFIPEVGNEFVILTWQEGLDGAFGDVIVDPWFTNNGLDFDLHYNNVSGAGNLTIEATPEPATLSLLALGGLAIIRRKSRR